MSQAPTPPAHIAARVAERGRESLQSAKRLPPDMAAPALQGAVNCAAALVNAGLSPADASLPQLPARIPKLSFIIPSINPSNLHRCRQSIERTFRPGSWELVHIDDARSMNDAYARGMNRASTDVLVFCHDDIVLLDDAFQVRLLDAMESADVVGVCGTTKVIAPGVSCAGLPHLHGWVTHRDARGRPLPSIRSAAVPRVDAIQALDGVFMAATRPVAQSLGFDGNTFDGWHLYDMDFSYRAYKAGFRVRVQADLLLIHASTGNVDEAYLRYAQRFAAKHAELVMPTQQGAPFFQTVLKSDAAVPAFYRWIREWSREG